MGTCLSKVKQWNLQRFFSSPVDKKRFVYDLLSDEIEEGSRKNKLRSFDVLPSAAYRLMKQQRRRLQEAMDRYHDGPNSLSFLREVCPGWDDSTIADVRGIFQMLDRNGDGVLDANEFNLGEVEAHVQEDSQLDNEESFMGFEKFIACTYKMAQEWMKDDAEVEVDLVETFMMFADHEEKGTQYTLSDVKNLFYVNSNYVRQIRRQSVAFQIQYRFL